MSALAAVAAGGRRTSGGHRVPERHPDDPQRIRGPRRTSGSKPCHSSRSCPWAAVLAGIEPVDDRMQSDRPLAWSRPAADMRGRTRSSMMTVTETGPRLAPVLPAMLALMASRSGLPGRARPCPAAALPAGPGSAKREPRAPRPTGQGAAGSCGCLAAGRARAVVRRRSARHCSRARPTSRRTAW